MIFKVLILLIFCKSMTTPEDKRIKEFIKNFFKQHKLFKEVSYSSKPDAALLYKKNDLTFHHIIIFNEVKKTPPEDIEDGWGVVYFKNTNPHDSRKASHGYVRRVVQKSCVRNYT